MASDITIYPYNILESGTTTTAVAPDAGYPIPRLYDRVKSLYYKVTADFVGTYSIDQGATGNLPVDFLAVCGHNFDGEDMAWQWSTDNWTSDIGNAVTAWTQSGNIQIIKTVSSPLTKRYWVVRVTTMPNTRCGEIFMGAGYTFDVMINPSGASVSNVSWNRTVGGDERGTKFGDLRRQRSYLLFPDAAGLTSLKTCLDYTDHFSKPFFIRDHFDEYYLCRLASDPPESYDNVTNTHVNIDIIEVL